MVIINKHSVIGGIVGAIVSVGTLSGIHESGGHEGIVRAQLPDGKYALANYKESWGKRSYSHVDIFKRVSKTDGKDVRVSEFNCLDDTESYIEDWYFEGGIKVGLVRFDGLPKNLVSALDSH